MNRGDRIFASILRLSAVSVALLLAWLVFFLFKMAWPAISRFGFGFLVTSTWDPVQDHFGAAPFIYGTVVSSVIAVLIAGPVSAGIALFLNELLLPLPAKIFGFLIQMLAAIPSVVYGLWGIFVLAPWLRRTVEPFLAHALGWVPGIGLLFHGAPYGVGMLAAGLVLSIMITPTVSSIALEVFRAIPNGQREAALALGATRWEMMQVSVIRSSRLGFLGAIVLGLGRALGETMAVTMLIGNRPEISASLFAPGQTMASVIANEYAEATSDLHLSALAAVGLTLFGVTFLLNSVARLLVWHVTRSTRGGH